jgi:hypothetical protein
MELVDCSSLQFSCLPNISFLKNNKVQTNNIAPTNLKGIGRIRSLIKFSGQSNKASPIETLPCKWYIETKC